MIGYVLGGGAAVVLAWLANGIRRIGAVSRGETIPARPGMALLLIDVQTVFWDDGPYEAANKARAEEAIRAEIDDAHAKGHPVIGVRQEWSIPSTKVLARLTMKGQAIAGTPGTELAAPFADLADHQVVKRVQDAFETGALDALLAQLDIGSLRICGLDLNYCVLKTALAAQGRGYDVTVVRDATLCAGEAQKAEAMLDARAILSR